MIRRYLNLHIIQILTKGVLHICEEMPDDLVEGLYSYVTENKLNVILSEKELDVNHNDFSNLSDKFSGVPSKKGTLHNF